MVPESAGVTEPCSAPTLGRRWSGSGGGSSGVRVVGLVDDAPAAVVLDQGEVVAVVDAGVLGAEPDEGGVPLE